MGLTKDRYERLNVRSMWKHEAWDFTECLADNLDLIGNLIGKNLELVGQERRVAPFLQLDILAKDTNTGKLVVIENQLEWSDTDHLGRLIAYSTVVDARIVIWVAPGFLYEHAKVLNRLNEWTEDDVEFYGIQVEVVKKTADSDPESRFFKVVYPGGWELENTSQNVPSSSPQIQKYTEFFEPIVKELLMTGFTEILPKKRFGDTGRFFPSPVNEGIWYAASLEKNSDAWVTLHIEADSNEMTKVIFDKLQTEAETIESSIIVDCDLEWHWLKHDNKRDRFSSVNIRMDADINDPEAKLQETKAWMLHLLPQLKEVFEPRIAKILKTS